MSYHDWYMALTPDQKAAYQRLLDSGRCVEVHLKDKPRLFGGTPVEVLPDDTPLVFGGEAPKPKRKPRSTP